MAKPASTSLRDIGPLQAFQRAVRLEDQGRFGEAERLYEAIRQADTHHFGAVYRLALIRLRRNKFDDAVRLFRRVVKIDRRSADAHHYLGFALTAAGRALECQARCTRKTILAIDFEDAPLTPEWGAPVRLRIPTKLGFKSAKNLQAIEVTNIYPGGFWEDQGYNWFSGS